MNIPQNTGINEHALKLIKNKQFSYGPIYRLGRVEQEMMKAYMETHLRTGFIRPSKSSAGTSIFLDNKPDKSLRLCVSDQDFNNLINKICYPLPLIGKFLDWLG